MLTMALFIFFLAFLGDKNSLPSSTSPSRLAIYYGYPSLVNGSNGDVEKAAAVFSAYDVVVLGDGLEFPEKQPRRIPEGDPGEHQRTLQLIASVRKRNPGTRFFGYVCLGDFKLPWGKAVVLTPEELKERIRLWKNLGVAGIFLDEAGYDYPGVTRMRQSMAIAFIHEQGLSAFMNAYFPDHLFSLDDNPPNASGPGKNPARLPPLLDRRDMFLLESFQVKNGVYESPSVWQPRVDQALEYRRRYGAQVFSTTTASEREPFSSQKFTYAWWTARLYGLDGFSWGEPSFAASSNTLRDSGCQPDTKVLSPLLPSPPAWLDHVRFWKRASDSIVVVDTSDHSVRIVRARNTAGQQDTETVLGSAENAVRSITCVAAAVNNGQ